MLKTLTLVFRSFLWGGSDCSEKSLLIFCPEGKDMNPSVLGAELGRRAMSLATQHSACVNLPLLPADPCCLSHDWHPSVRGPLQRMSSQTSLRAGERHLFNFLK